MTSTSPQTETLGIIAVPGWRKQKQYKISILQKPAKLELKRAGFALFSVDVLI